MNTSYAGNQTGSKVRDMVITSLLIAMVFVATRFINVQLPISINGGLVHLGNTMLFTAAIVFGSKKGAAAGAFGMGLFDLLSGGPWVRWAPFTFVVRGVMGYIIGSFANAGGRNGKSILWNIVGIVVASVWMLPAYYLTEVVLNGNWITPVNSIPGNLLQIAIGLVAIPLASALKRTKLV